MRRQFVAMTALSLSVPALSLAQDFPGRPIRMLVGFAPGGPTDILARLTALAMGKALGQSVVVENRPGAGGAVAAQALARAEPDGYTIMFAGDGQLTLLPQLSASAGYDTLRDYAVIRTVAGQSNVLMANRSSGITDMASLLRIAKEQPDKLSFGSAGNGTPSHLVGALFEDATGTRLLHAPYRGAGPAMADFLAGRLDLMFVGMPVALQNALDKKLSILATTGRRRSALLPDVPTFFELGIQGLGEDTDVWWAVAAPVATPSSIQARLDSALRTALQEPTVRQSFDKLGVDLLERASAASVVQIKSDQARWARLLKAGKIRIE
jgi:tripartite-type tricarboxylate transporter receptor subunit TctC